MAKKQKKQKKMIISGKEIVANSANKENKSMPHVSTGTGRHKSKKDYTRKKKHKKRYEDIM